MFWTITIILICLWLFFTFPKQLLTVTLILGGFTILLWAIDANKTKKSNKIRDAVKIVIKYDTNFCSKEYPLLVGISNNSKKVISKISWGLSAYNPGYSNDLIEHNGMPNIYKILMPGEHYVFCRKIPMLQEACDPENLIYKINYKHLTLDNGDAIYYNN